ncbi:MAG: hypothetical protein RL757_2636 [Bacteroidota bacterium]|jgi:dethiobiotin synthetase
MTYKNIYVAATSQHVGKTTSTLGLVAAFRNMGINVGYCKPVGQQFVLHNGVQVDKDVVLFGDLLGFEPVPELHSPVILGSGTTSDFLESPEKYDFAARLQYAKQHLPKHHDLMVFEGTGHTGVGSCVGFSNAKVAKELDAHVIMVVEGGIGSTIDMLDMCMAMFREQNVPIMGVILNKVLDEKREKVTYYVKKWLEKHNLPLIGVLPYDVSMSLPQMQQISDSVKGKVEFNADKLDGQVQDIVAGSLISYEELVSKKMGSQLLVVGASRLDLAISDTIFISEKHDLKGTPFVGIVSTGEGKYSRRTLKYINDFKIPVVRTALETYGAVLKISKIEVKINQKTPWKVQRAIELIENNVDLNQILEMAKI